MHVLSDSARLYLFSVLFTGPHLLMYVSIHLFVYSQPMWSVFARHWARKKIKEPSSFQL